MAWEYVGRESGLELQRMHHFAASKKQGDQMIDFLIAVREYPADSQRGPLRFFAQADKQTNQKTAPYTPSGWGPTLEAALSSCLTEINRFPYEGNEDH